MSVPDWPVPDPRDMNGEPIPASGWGATPDHAGRPASPAATRTPGERVKRALGPLGGLVLLIVKFGTVLLKVKFVGTLLTALVSIAAYTLLWGWPFAVGFVALLFVHELGHVVELRRQGIKASVPMFIPFLGAFVKMESVPRSAAAEARSALAGPMVGGAAAALVALAGALSGSALLTGLAFTGFVLNLFNLLPALPLDGGRVAAVMHPVVWLIGMAGLAILMIIHPNVVIALVLVYGGFELRGRWRKRNTPEGRAYRDVPRMQRAGITLVYVALVVSLAGAAALTYVQRSL